MADDKWIWTCPICKTKMKEDLPLDEVRQYIGATHDCPYCGGTVLINKDLTCSDFGEYLVQQYASMGHHVTKEQALGNYVGIGAQTPVGS